MENKNHVIDILYENLNIDKDILLEIIETPLNAKMGDYSIPCFKVRCNCYTSPIEIARSIKDKLQGHEYFEEVQQVGAYVNIYINKNIIIGNIIEKILKGKEYFGSSEEGKGKTIIINYRIGNGVYEVPINLEQEHLGRSLEKMFVFQGYHVIDIHNEWKNSEKNILDMVLEIERKGLLSEYNNFKVVKLKEYNLPPCIIIKENGHFAHGIKDLAFIMYVINKYECYKFINLIERNKWIYINQVKGLSKVLEYDLEGSRVLFTYYNYKKENSLWGEHRIEEIKAYEIIREIYNKLSYMLSESYENCTDRNLCKRRITEKEFEHVIKLGNFPDIIKEVIVETNPLKLLDYLLDISVELKNIYMRLENNNEAFGSYNVQLIEASLQVLKNGMVLMGIKKVY